MNRFKQETRILLHPAPSIRVRGTGIFVRGPFPAELLEPDQTFKDGFMIDLCHATEGERKYIQLILKGEKHL